MLGLDGRNQLNATTFDPKSIMLYAFPKTLIRRLFAAEDVAHDVLAWPRAEARLQVRRISRVHFCGGVRGQL
jgi:hypothetical protein